jgi:LCP family protein required for cell wall assembly
MSRQSGGSRKSRELKNSEVNLVSARAELNTEFNEYSRTTRSGGYVQQRVKKDRSRRIIIAITLTFTAILVALVAAVGAYLYWAGETIKGDLDFSTLSGVTVDRAKPEDPFWMLLVGKDLDEDGISRTDSIILARINPGDKSAALVSIPRDTRINLPGYGYQKINAAYAYGELERQQGENHSGAEYIVQEVSELTGIGVSAYAEIDLNGFMSVVDALGGVYVEVPLDIIGDVEAGWVDVYAGPQVLDGAHAMVFVRSRQYAIGDYQRQANQRTFLQAMAKQLLASDPVTVVNTVTQICQMTSTNMEIGEIAAVANAMRGMQESDIYTYSIPSEMDMIDEISYVIADVGATRELCSAINNGEFPDASSWSYQGEAAPQYKPRSTSETSARTGDIGTGVETSAFTVDVRNGYGIEGAASGVSGTLNLSGYIQGEIGNAGANVYEQTLIVYKQEKDREAALDIRARLGYGRVIPSLDRYSFDGDVLVVVGADYKP